MPINICFILELEEKILIIKIYKKNKLKLIMMKGEESKQNKILVIHCGGTFGMVSSENGFTVKKNNVYEIFKKNFESEKSNFKKNIFDGEIREKNKSYVLYKKTFLLKNSYLEIEFKLCELNKIIDSSNVDISDWSMLCNIIDTCRYDGYVVIYGTDTMSYAMAAVSFAIKNTKSPIIFTGAQLPVVIDLKGMDNLIGAIEICGLMLEREMKCNVWLYFSGFLHSGVKARKITSCGFKGFWSRKEKVFGIGKAESIELIENIQNEISKQFIGEEFNLSKNKETLNFFEFILQNSENEKFEKNSVDLKNIGFEQKYKFSKNVALLKIYPGISKNIFEIFLKESMGCVLECYGSGNFCILRTDLLSLLKEYIERGNIVVVVSQCLEGNVEDLYECGNVLKTFGCVLGKWITSEAAYCKLAFVLENFPKKSWKAKIIENLKGEMEF
ncbi:putative asparaginase [Hamiltosporidium tvaerminnensis]|uniref:asparaginase n=2 Tax=Hamiltosporidium tvaerminnensis TaxID=1176355 RepID=A0A4Q9LQ00_9MICR|nr:putative asparaginase [Hamiltosporidium tvaerminnensis]